MPLKKSKELEAAARRKTETSRRDAPWQSDYPRSRSTAPAHCDCFLYARLQIEDFRARTAHCQVFECPAPLEGLVKDDDARIRLALESRQPCNEVRKWPRGLDLVARVNDTGAQIVRTDQPAGEYIDVGTPSEPDIDLGK